MTIFRANSAPITIFASDPRAIYFPLLDINGAPQLLTGRDFVFVVRRANLTTPLIIEAPMILSLDGLYAIATLTAAQTQAIYDGRDYAMAYDMVEVTAGASTQRWTGRINPQPAPSLPTDAEPVWIDLPAAQVVAAAEVVAVSERGAVSPIEKRLKDLGLTDAATPEAMVEWMRANGAEGGLPFAEAAAESAGAAAVDRTASEQAATRSEVAQGKAEGAAVTSALGLIYEDKDEGLAATAEGETFRAYGPSYNYVTRYRKTNGQAVREDDIANGTRLRQISYSISGLAGKMSSMINYSGAGTILPEISVWNLDGKEVVAHGVRKSDGAYMHYAPVDGPGLTIGVVRNLRGYITDWAYNGTGNIVPFETLGKKAIFYFDRALGRPVLHDVLIKGDHGLDVGSGGGIVTSIVYGKVNEGQSNAEAQAGTSTSIVRIQYPPAGKIRMLASLAGNIWLGKVTSAGASVPLLQSEITGLTDLVGALGSATHGTTSGEGYVFALSKALSYKFMGVTPEILLINNAEGGQTIANLRAGAPDGFYAYSNFVNQVTRANALVVAEGKRFVLDVIEMEHGESNPTLSTLGAEHEAFRAEREAAVMAITGQTERVRLLDFQMSSFMAGQFQGVLDILREHVAQLGPNALLHLIGPTYNFRYSSDYLHHSSVEHERRGQLVAAMNMVLINGGQWDALRMLSRAVTGTNQITVTMSEPIVIDAAGEVDAVTDAGVTLVGGTVSSVTASGASLIISTVGAAADVTAVRVALSGHVTTRAQATVPRSNIRSAASYGRYLDGRDIRKWAAHQHL